jgi:hypothetical protein
MPDAAAQVFAVVAIFLEGFGRSFVQAEFAQVSILLKAAEQALVELKGMLQISNL